jgi:hypothetical protein
MYDRIEYWYDRSLRLWTALWLDPEGNQLGIAQYAVRKTELLLMIDRMTVSEPCDYQI